LARCAYGYKETLMYIGGGVLLVVVVILILVFLL
jgi:hypothetical protein